MPGSAAFPAFRSIYPSGTTFRSEDCPIAPVESGEPRIRLRSRAIHQSATALVTSSIERLEGPELPAGRRNGLGFCPDTTPPPRNRSRNCLHDVTVNARAPNRHTTPRLVPASAFHQAFQPAPRSRRDHERNVTRWSGRPGILRNDVSSACHFVAFARRDDPSNDDNQFLLHRAENAPGAPRRQTDERRCASLREIFAAIAAWRHHADLRFQ